MLDTLRVTRSVSVRTMTIPIGGDHSRLELELRAVAEDMAGRLDRDELARADEVAVSEALEAAVAAALPAVMEILDQELTPRLEALPLATRLTLSRARRRLEFGLD
ncbi:MAG: hypothetical protein WCK58_13585 [Chloroflexota bacterium]